MTTGPSGEFARTRLQLANEMLNNARTMLDEGSLRSAAGRAYYAMFHAAQAALIKHGLKPPKTHRGLRALFGERLAKAGLIEGQYSTDFVAAQQMRRIGTYELYVNFGVETVTEIVSKAENFVRRIEVFVQEEKQ